MNKWHYYDGAIDPNRKAIGSSDIGTICGVNPWQTPYELWRKLRGLDEPFQGNERTEAGHMMEPWILAQYVRVNYGESVSADFVFNAINGQNIISRKSEFHRLTEIYNPDAKFNVSHADLVDVSYNGENALIVECKNTTGYNKRGTDITQGYDYNDLTATGLPMTVHLQVQNQMHCYGIDKAVVCVLVDGWRYLEYEVEYSAKVNAAINDKITWFWNCVESGEEPDLMTYEDTILKWPEPEPEKFEIINDDEQAIAITQALDNFLQINKKMTKMKATAKELRTELQKHIEGNERLINEDGDTILRRVKAGSGWTFKGSK